MATRHMHPEDLVFGDGTYDTTTYQWKAFQSYKRYLDALQPKLQKLNDFEREYHTFLDKGQKVEADIIRKTFEKRRNGSKKSPGGIMSYIGMFRPDDLTGLCERMDALARTYAISHTLITKSREREAQMKAELEVAAKAQANADAAAQAQAEVAARKTKRPSSLELAAAQSSFNRQLGEIQIAMDAVGWVPSDPSQYFTEEWMEGITLKWMPIVQYLQDASVVDEEHGRSVSFNVELKDGGLEGAFGRVFAVDLNGTDHMNNTRVAVKQPKLTQYRKTDNVVKRFVREMKNLKDVGEHDHIVPIYGGFWLGGIPHAVFGWAPYGTLDDYVRNRRMDAPRIRLLKEAASGLAHMHSHNFTHCDFSPKNIIVSPQETAWIIDFGLSKGPTMPTSSATVRSQGAWMCKAPEILERLDDDDDAEDYEQDNDGILNVMDRGSRNQKTDVYAFGITMFVILSLQDPFPLPPYASSLSERESQIISLKRQVKAGTLRPSPFPRNSPKGESWQFAEDIATRCWAQDPDQRYKMSVVVEKLAASGLD